MDKGRELSVRNLEDLAVRAVRGWQRVFTGFLDPAGWQPAHAAASQAGCMCAMYGPGEDPERRMVCFYPESEEPPRPDEYPAELLCVRWNTKFNSLEHRDILGSLMGLGLEREAVGDIRILQGMACFPAEKVAAAYIRAELTQAGRCRVHAEPLSVWPDEDPEDWIRTRVVVSALRLDALVAAGYKLSRSEASALVEGGAVKVEHLPCLKPDKQLAQGCMISVRGKGRLRLAEVGGVSAKGRLHIELDRTK